MSLGRACFCPVTEKQPFHFWLFGTISNNNNNDVVIDLLGNSCQTVRVDATAGFNVLSEDTSSYLDSFDRT